LLFSPAAQKKMDWNSSTMNSMLRVTPIAVPMELWSLLLFRFTWELSVFRDIIYVIIILYSWYLVICKHFWSYMWNSWSWVMHTMSTWFCLQNRVWQYGIKQKKLIELSKWNKTLIFFRFFVSFVYSLKKTESRFYVAQRTDQSLAQN
jgi:hypothetical protein